MGIAIALVMALVLTLTADLRIAESDVIEYEVSAPELPASIQREIETLADETASNWDCMCVVCDADSWVQFEADAMAEYAAEFDALYATIEYRVAKNGRGMIRTGNSGPYKFVKKG